MYQVISSQPPKTIPNRSIWQRRPYQVDRDPEAAARVPAEPDGGAVPRHPAVGGTRDVRGAVNPPDHAADQAAAQVRKVDALELSGDLLIRGKSQDLAHRRNRNRARSGCITRLETARFLPVSELSISSNAISLQLAEHGPV